MAVRPMAAPRWRPHSPIKTIGIPLGALAVAAPVVALLITALLPNDGAGTLSHLAQTVLPRYLATTLWLVLIVAVVSLLIGVRCAWLVAACEFPGRRWLAGALVLPLAMPAFVMAYAYTDFLGVSGPVQSALRELTGWRVREYWFPEIRSTMGAGVFLALALYPYIYLLGRTAFAERPESLDEAGRALGLSARAAWWRVVWPMARPAIAAGLILVLMETLADFGVVTYFAVDSLTAGIYRAWQALGDRIAAARLAVVLLLLVSVLVWAERKQRGQMRFHGRSSRPASRVTLRGVRGMRASLTCLVPVVFGFALPAYLLLTGWLNEGAVLDPRLTQWMMNSIKLAALGAIVTVPAGLLAAYVIRTRADQASRVAVAIANGGYALPGTVLGIGLLLVVGLLDNQIIEPLTGSVLLSGTVFAVIYAYLVRFFSVAYQGLDAGLKRIPLTMDDSARSLGRRPRQVLTQIHWPLLKRSVAVAALLVAIECLKELPATLVLRPFNTDTLAVVAYQFAADERLAEAALPALVIVAVGVLPVILLSRAALRD